MEPCRRHAVTLRLATSVYLSLCLCLSFALLFFPSPIPPPPAWRVCRVCFVLHICLDLLFLFSGRTKLKFSMQILVCSRVALEISVNTPAHPPPPSRNPSHFSLPTFVLVPFLVALPKCNCFFAWSAANSRKSPHRVDPETQTFCTICHLPLPRTLPLLLTFYLSVFFM